uniref:Peptidase A1 domain-containing protein n=1 Tax=Chromera velia CCMP2878 TaxID=1169474 RepID=A0A0G4I6D1_9ALVE|mmetsp:Transcript_1738/g.3594  ORF Transcript_1738/g.3594 Transcript_1738/m.3594 type:complete len:726 (-) Transcript_1738:40-2217(-)|eukprot:Cvel_11379.t1-p1 / transcript=Cvel_11379.t1 / gene=Cvel_11379 / organism=Chromera_velia_CCMP2878 / gene_product=hypothetical protein / transcript_product=hypothetical protein / location=Cvel_scaffold713:49088-54321(-) / protein_length=725 / sequence_SO=supercontig / SO=protein_coding / is_pseudo=false
MKFVSALFLTTCLSQVDSAVDLEKFKFEGLKVPDLSGLTGGKEDLLKGGKSGTGELLRYFVAPPALNETVPVFGSKEWTLEFGCFEVDSLIRGFFILDVQPTKEDLGVIIGGPNSDFSPLPDGLVQCEAPDDDSGLFTIAPVDGGLRCIVAEDEGETDDIDVDETEVIGRRTSPLNGRFSDKTQFTLGDNFAGVMMTGAAGNSTFTNDFGVPSSCAIFGDVFVDGPKGAKFFVGPPPNAKGEKEIKESDEGKAGLLPSFDSLLKFGNFEIPSLGGLSLGGGKAALPGAVKGKGPFKGVLSYYVNSPSINSTVTVFSSDFLDMDFSCIQQGADVFGVQSFKFKGGKNGVTLLKQTPDSTSEGDVPPQDFLPDCFGEISDLLPLSPDEEIACLHDGERVDSDDTEVDVGNLDEVNFLFSNGFQVSQTDDEVSVAVTGVEGNATFEEFFGAPSSCAIYGPIFLDIPKGVSFELNSELPKSSVGSEKETDGEDKKDDDGAFKLDGLADSFKFDLDLSALSGGVDKGAAVSDLTAQTKEALQYYRAPPALNTTVNVFSTGEVSLDFACSSGLIVDDDSGRTTNSTIGVYIMTVTPKKRDLAFLVQNDDDGDEEPFGVVGCETLQDSDNDLVVVPAGETLQCHLELFRVDDDETDIRVTNDDEAAVQFSNGFQFSMEDGSIPIIMTGADGNSTLTDFFKAPSSCATFGRVLFLAPKGVKLDVLGKGAGTFP